MECLAGISRRNRIQLAAAGHLCATMEELCRERDISTLLVGDLAAARLQPNPEQRIVHQFRVLVPHSVSRRQLTDLTESVITRCGASSVPSGRGVIEHLGVRACFARSLGAEFAFSRSRRAVWQSSNAPAVVTFASIAATPPQTPLLWYLDMVTALNSHHLDLDQVLHLAQESRWTPPVTEAVSVLRQRGWQVPRVEAHSESRVNRAYQRANQSEPSPQQQRRRRRLLWARVLEERVGARF